MGCCSKSCLSFASGPSGGSDTAHVTEKRYGCYKSGIVFALVIILLLVAGCVPAFLFANNNNLILLILLVTLVAIGLVTFGYLRWQRSRAQAMRRTYEQQKFALTRLPAAAVSSPKASPGETNGTPVGGTGVAKHDALYAAYGQNGLNGFGKMTQGQGHHHQPTDQELDSSISMASKAANNSTAAKNPPRYSFI